jgi:hypothetical protein
MNMFLNSFRPWIVEPSPAAKAAFALAFAARLKACPDTKLDSVNLTSGAQAPSFWGFNAALKRRTIILTDRRDNLIASFRLQRNLIRWL